jgi:hypothetical protein
VPPLNSEVEIKNALGIESWRNLSKDTFLRFLASLPEIDPEVALKLIAQVPEITQLAKAALVDAAKAYDAALKSNARSQEMVHEIHLKRLEILEAELDKDLTPEDRMRVLEEIQDVNSNALLKDTENKRFISAQFDKKLAMAGAAFATVIAVVFAAARSGDKPTPGAGRLGS